MRPLLRIWIEDWDDWGSWYWSGPCMSSWQTSSIDTSLFFWLVFFVLTYEILMSGSLNAPKSKVCWECSIGIFELNVSSHLHTNVSIMSLISSSHKYFKYICRGRNEHEQGIKREKMTDILPRNHCPNICTKYLLLFKTNFTMKGAQQTSLFLTFFTRQGSCVYHANVYYKLYRSDAKFHPLTKAW